MTNQHRSPSAWQGPWLAGCALWCALASGSAAAQDLSTKFPINDTDPESAVPTNDDAMKNPLQMGYWIMLVTERAASASKKGDHAKAVKYYRALARAVPDRATSYTRMCKSYEAMGDWKNAVASCKVALTKGGVTAADSVRFVKLVLRKQEPLTRAEIALEVIDQHLVVLRQ